MTFDELWRMNLAEEKRAILRAAGSNWHANKELFPMGRSSAGAGLVGNSRDERPFTSWLDCSIVETGRQAFASDIVNRSVFSLT